MTTSGTSGDSSLNMSLSSGTGAQGAVALQRSGQERADSRSSSARPVGVQRRVAKRSTSVPRPRPDMPTGSGVQGSASYQQLNLQQVYHEAPNNAEVVRAAASQVLGL